MSRRKRRVDISAELDVTEEEEKTNGNKLDQNEQKDVIIVVLSFSIKNA